MKDLERRRVLLTLSSGRIGGAEHHTQLLARALAAREDHEVEVACRPGPLQERLVADGIAVHPLAFGDGVDVVTPLRLAGLARRFHVLHAHMNRAALYTRIASFLSGTPWMATAHGMTRGVYYRGAGAVVAVSGAVEEHLAGQGVERLVTVWNGLPEPEPDPEGAAAVRRACGLVEGQEGAVVLVMANRHSNKGHELALDILPFLPPEVRLLMSGDGVDDPELHARAERLGVSARVTLRGPYRGTAAPMEAADLVLVPSYREAFSLVAAEARMRGRPVVASDVDGLAEVVPEDAPACRRVEGRDPELWAEVVKQLLTPEARRRAAADAPRARELFALSRWIAETLPVYARVSCGP